MDDLPDVELAEQEEGDGEEEALEEDAEEAQESEVAEDEELEGERENEPGDDEALEDSGDVEALEDLEESAEDEGEGLGESTEEGEVLEESATEEEAVMEEEEEREMTELDTEVTVTIDAACVELERVFSERLLAQSTRLAASAQQLQLAVETRREMIAEGKRKYNEVQTQLQSLLKKLQREQEERLEERQWLAQLWPEDTPLPTLLLPLRRAAKAQQSASKPNEADAQEVALVKDVEDETERQRLQALVARRVERERVRQQLEEASHWKVVISEDLEDGEQQTAYYMNTYTGVSVWDPPVAMFFEPPPGWDLVAMDWEANYDIENVASDVKAPAPSREGGASGEEAASDQEMEPYGDDDNDEDEDEDEDEEDLASDPVPIRERMEQELQRSAQLKAEVEESVARQRSLAMELLMATRASFEREQQQLEEEDAIVIVEERKRRTAERQEQAAAQAKAEAQRKKQQAAGKTGGPSVQPTFSRDSMAKKSLTLAADDHAFEQELREFAHEQRADRLYLAMPATRDSRVRNRHQLEPEYVHMKHVESRVLEAEKLEFDLLEKSALRHEEASTKADELRELCAQIRQQQHEVELELPSVEAAIARLEAAEAAPPEVPRPSEEQLLRAAERFLLVDPLSSDEEGQDEAEGSLEVSAALSVDDQKAVDEGEKPTEVAAEATLPDASTPAVAVIEADEQRAAASDAPSNDEEDARVKEDETELRELKTFTDAERAWRDWEKTETTRITELTSFKSRRLVLMTSQKQLAVDLALYEDGDAPFFERLRDLEHAAHSRLWDQQAQAQVERARFVVERAAREESVYQLRDRVKELQQQQEDARCLPRQALHPLDRVELEAQAQKLTMELQKQAAELQTRYAKEEEAKTRLMQLEARACDYAEAKLQEETKLFTEKQTLWNLNFTLADELQSCRQTIERLYLLMQEEGGDGGQEMRPEDAEPSGLESKGDDTAEEEQQTVASPRELYEENARVFETKLQYFQQVRQFLFTCYDREDRWRALAGVALVKDVTSDDWMSAMQRGRHEDSLALLQAQHDEQQQVLQRQLKLLGKVKTALQAQIEDLNNKMRRLQSDYQSASESVRLQTQQVIEALRAEVEAQKGVAHSEQLRFKTESERLLREHEVVREGLEKRLHGLEDVNVTQTHWLTAAKRELHAQRVANEELLKAYQSLEKRRASEINDMRFRIAAQIKKISNIEMWNLSLKISAKEAHVELVKVQEAMAEQEQQHKQLQRRLRLQNWRHRVTAQAILTDVDLLFAFFADGIAIVSGATTEANDALRENAGIEVLAALARHSSQQSIRAICARALGQLVWNANATARSLGWQAKRTWFQWMTTQSEVVLNGLEEANTAFDAVAGEEETETNWLADTSAPIDDISGECDHDMSTKGGKMKAKKLQFTATWQQFDDKVFPGTNVANQQHMGLSANVLQTILDLCRSPETDRQVHRNALLSLALIVRSSRNTAVIGRMDGSIALLVQLMTPKSDSSTLQEPEDPHVVRHAVQALGNLAFRNTFNQQVIYAQGAIPLLLNHCDRTLNSSDALDADVDLTLASAQALAHLTHEHIPSCQAIVAAQGVSILTRLCNSLRIRDAIDLEVYELIQTYAAQVIANVITLLDRDDNDSDLRAQHIADLVLEQEARGFPGYSSGVDKVGSGRDPDNQELSDESRPRSSSKHAGVATFVLMCASCNRDVAFHGAIVLGSIAQHDAIRAAIGAASGVDALFLLADRSEDLPMVAQATWALANLTWNRENQYRIARYLDHLYQLCTLNATATTRVSLNQQELEEIPQEEQDNDEMLVENAVVEAQRKQQDAQLIQQIREHALCILANSLFYNEANRQLVASHANWMQLLTRNCLDAGDVTLEHSARALCSLSYSDSIALQMGTAAAVERPNTSSSSRTGRTSTPATTPMNGLYVFTRLCARSGPVAVQQHGLFGVINMCLHDANKSRMLEIPHGIDTLVNLSGHTNPELCEPALEALELLADLRQLKQDHGVSSTQSFASVDMKKLIALLSDATSPTVVAMISDAIADEVWKKPSSQVRLRNEHGLEKLLELCVKQPPLFPAAMTGSSPAVAAEMERRVLISCLWALRNTVANNVRNQDLVGALGGVQQLIGVFDRQRQHEEVVEALLAALVALVMKHPRNSQQLVQFGLDMLIGLADSTGDSERLEEERRGGRGQKRGVTLPPLTPSSARKSEPINAKYAVESADGGELLENATLARELLHLVAPFNTRGDATTAPPSPNAKVRRMQELHASLSPVQRR
ncbi:hypothetical protein BBJ28_00007875 [Nothophytophthora sp. Chile5]|nr:hypothetical protein BBJ28_00007875 [Nothophytophthora sp. Chile5]